MSDFENAFLMGTTNGGETMELYDSKSYTFEEKDYEIRIYFDDVTINVVPFLNDYPANGYRYQVKIPNGCDVRKVLETSPVPELVETCQNDIKNGQWDSLSRIIDGNKSP